MKPELSPLTNAILMQLGNTPKEGRDAFENHIFQQISMLSQKIKEGNSTVISLRAEADETEQRVAQMAGKYEALAESLQVYYQAREQAKAPTPPQSPQNAPVSPEGAGAPDAPESPESPQGKPNAPAGEQSEPSPVPSPRPESPEGAPEPEPESKTPRPRYMVKPPKPAPADSGA